MRYSAMSAPRVTGGSGVRLSFYSTNGENRMKPQTNRCGRSRRSGREGSGAIRERDSGGAVAAVPVGVLVQVLLVVVLGVVVRRLAVLHELDLRGDRVEAAAGELLAVLLGEVARGLLLLGRGGVDAGAVLGADVV